MEDQSKLDTSLFAKCLLCPINVHMFFIGLKKMVFTTNFKATGQYQHLSWFIREWNLKCYIDYNDDAFHRLVKRYMLGEDFLEYVVSFIGNYYIFT